MSITSEMVNTPASLRSDLITISPESVVTISGIRRFSPMAIQMSDIRAHGLDERILVESFYKAVRASYRMIKVFSS